MVARLGSDSEACSLLGQRSDNSPVRLPRRDTPEG